MTEIEIGRLQGSKGLYTGLREVLQLCNAADRSAPGQWLGGGLIDSGSKRG